MMIDVRRERATGMNAQRITLPIYNLGCTSETRLVERILRAVPGVSHVYVNPATEMAYVEYDPAQSGSAQLFAVLEREGYGQPARRPATGTVSSMTARQSIDARRFALAGGLWLAAVYTLCVLADLLFPEFVQMARLWELILIGVDWTNPLTLPLGLVEIFLYGVVGAWSFAALYNALPRRTPDPVETTCCGTPTIPEGSRTRA
jgi:cation transport ATPase